MLRILFFFLVWATNSFASAVELAIEPNTEVPLNQLFTMSLILRNGEGWELQNCTASMPGHGHGMEVIPRLEIKNHERFNLIGMKFHMPGIWRVECAAKKAGKQIKLFFDYKL